MKAKEKENNSSLKTVYVAPIWSGQDKTAYSRMSAHMHSELLWGNRGTKTPQEWRLPVAGTAGDAEDVKQGKYVE